MEIGQSHEGRLLARIQFDGPLKLLSGPFHVALLGKQRSKSGTIGSLARAQLDGPVDCFNRLRKLSLA